MSVRIHPELARRRTSELMARAQRDIPLFHVSRRAATFRLRRAAAQTGTSLTGALLPIVSRWLLSHPLLNAHWNDGVELKDSVDLGIAWSHDDVLIVPALADCATWNVERFVAEISGLRDRSARNAFLAGDFRKPTFTISNLGATGIESFTSLVTPPQVAVLSIAAASDQVVARAGEVTVEEMVPLTLGVDHRAIDGAYAARAVGDLVTAIEEFQT